MQNFVAAILKKGHYVISIGIKTDMTKLLTHNKWIFLDRAYVAS